MVILKKGVYLLGNLKNERGVIFPVAIVILFLTTSIITYYALAFDSTIKIYKSLELANVRDTINLLDQINE